MHNAYQTQQTLDFRSLTQYLLRYLSIGAIHSSRKQKLRHLCNFFVSGLSEQLQHDDLIKADPA